MNKETIYDNKISPLVKKIIEICKQDGIAMIANFSIPKEDDDGLQATTNIPNGSGVFPENHRRAMQEIKRGATCLAVTITTG
ncbi:MAG: hypothetical protein M0R03_20330 [Novosphingobium sp.]|nr:hypothetical protein [Novosphingobium sp.]